MFSAVGGANIHDTCAGDADCPTNGQCAQKDCSGKKCLCESGFAPSTDSLSCLTGKYNYPGVRKHAGASEKVASEFRLGEMVFARSSGFLHDLHTASRHLTLIWQKNDKNRIS